MSPLHRDEKLALLQIARHAVESALKEQNPVCEPARLRGNLAALSGAFVTLHCRGCLRGCIGRVAAVEPLAEVVADCAVAALDDPRFPRMKPRDLGEMRIEVSVLSAPLRARPEEVQPGVHGLIISQGEKRGVLLPQVATERRWPRERFLEETCEKAGLRADAWRSPDTNIEIFTAEVFSESEAPSGSNAAGGDPYSNSQKSPS